MVSGVGAANMQRLLSAKITSVDQLHHVYRVMCGRDRDRMAQFLSTHRIARNHANQMIEWLEDPENFAPTKRVSIAVEGNIGAGKSTFLKILERNFETLGSAAGEARLDLNIVPEAST